MVSFIYWNNLSQSVVSLCNRGWPWYIAITQLIRDHSSYYKNSLHFLKYNNVGTKHQQHFWLPQLILVFLMLPGQTRPACSLHSLQGKTKPWQKPFFQRLFKSSPLQSRVSYFTVVLAFEAQDWSMTMKYNKGICWVNVERVPPTSPEARLQSECMSLIALLMFWNWFILL